MPRRAVIKTEIVPAPELGELTPNDELVREIVNILAARAWEPGHSEHALAKKHDKSVQVVNSARAAAARYLRLITDQDATRRLLLYRAREICEEDKPDRVPALGLLAKMTGVLEPPRDGGPKTRAERVEYLRGCLRDPDDELGEALEAEREALLGLLLPAAEATS